MNSDYAMLYFLQVAVWPSRCDSCRIDNRSSGLNDLFVLISSINIYRPNLLKKFIYSTLRLCLSVGYSLLSLTQNEKIIFELLKT